MLKVLEVEDLDEELPERKLSDGGKPASPRSHRQRQRREHYPSQGAPQTL